MELDFESNWISNATIPSIPEWRDLKIKKNISLSNFIIYQTTFPNSEICLI